MAVTLVSLWVYVQLYVRTCQVLPPSRFPSPSSPAISIAVRLCVSVSLSLSSSTTHPLPHLPFLASLSLLHKMFQDGERWKGGYVRGVSWWQQGYWVSSAPNGRCSGAV